MPQFIYIGVSAPVVLELTYIAKSTATTANVGLPSGWQDGDFAVLFDGAQSPTTAPASVTPAGWTNVRDDFLNTTASLRGMISYRVLQSGDSGPTGMAGATSEIKSILIFRPTVAIASVSAIVTNGQVTNSAPTTQTIGISTAVAPCVIVGHAFANAIVTAGNVTGTLVDNGSLQQGGNTTHRLVHEIQNTTLASRALSMADVSTNALQSVRFELSA